jgi:hypothetical protein
VRGPYRKLWTKFFPLPYGPSTYRITLSIVMNKNGLALCVWFTRVPRYRTMTVTMILKLIRNLLYTPASVQMYMCHGCLVFLMTYFLSALDLVNLASVLAMSSLVAAFNFGQERARILSTSYSINFS